MLPWSRLCCRCSGRAPPACDATVHSLARVWQEDVCCGQDRLRHSLASRCDTSASTEMPYREEERERCRMPKSGLARAGARVRTFAAPATNARRAPARPGTPERVIGWVNLRNGATGAQAPRSTGGAYLALSVPARSPPAYPTGPSFTDPQSAPQMREVSRSSLTSLGGKVSRGSRRQSEEILDNMREREHFDLVDDLALRLPLTVICRLLQVPDGQTSPEFHDWAGDVGQFAGWSTRRGAQYPERIEAGQQKLRLAAPRPAHRRQPCSSNS